MNCVPFAPFTFRLPCGGESAIILNMKTTGKSAFTLLEMLVVIGIIGILMGVVITQFGGATESAKAAQCETNMKSLVTAAHTCALEQKDGFYPVAESFWYENPNHKTFKMTYPRRIGWISGSEKNGGGFTKIDFEPVSFNDGKEKVLYALTNGNAGAMWKAMKEDRSAYQCPIHAEAVRKATGTPPGWSYVMNQEFGCKDTKRNGSWWGQTHEASISIPRKDRKKKARQCSPEKVLMFAELQGADVREPGCDPINASSYLKASGRQGDAVLRYDAGESIGFNHKTGKRGCSGHVAFADGHVERLAYPRSGSGLSLKDLTEKLCRGHEITYDGKGYADLTTDDN